MKTSWIRLLLPSILAIGTTLTPITGRAAAQTAGQDMKNAGTDTKNAAKSTGSGIKRGISAGYRKTKNGTKRVYHKSGHGLAKAGDKMAGKPRPQ